MNDHLLDRDELGFEEWSVTPSPEALVPDSIARERDRESFRSELRARSPNTVIVSHTDADGLTSAALLALRAENSVIQTVGYQDAYRFEHVLEDLTDEDSGFEPNGATLFVADFNPDGPECARALGELIDHGCRVEWYDHHQWESTVRNYVEATGVELVVDTEECAASLIEREVFQNTPEHIEELVAVTKDRDLWINDDPRSPTLNTFASIAGPEEYVDTVLRHGVDFPAGVEERIEERIERDSRLEQAAVQRVEYYRVGEEFDAGLTYTSGGNTSNIGNELAENHDPLFDLAIVCTPTSVSFYSHSEIEPFNRCHDIAGELGGGGHPTAAGCGVPVETFRELATYWASGCVGTEAETAILNACAAVMDGESA